MSEHRIERIEIRKTSWDIPDLGQHQATAAVGYAPGEVMKTSTYAFTITTNTGFVGEYVGGNSVAAAQIKGFADYLLGKDAFARERIYNDLKRILRKFDRLGQGPIDIALWDLAGKIFEAPVHELIGTHRTSLPTYASTAVGDRCGGLDSPQAYAEFGLHCRELGYPAYKMHIWPDYNIDELVATIRLVRETVGDDMQVMLDPGCKIDTFAEAWRIGKACDDAQFLWLEDPYKDSGVSIHGHRQLKTLIKTPILATEMVRGLEQHVDFIASGATDLVRVDAEYDGGITGALKIAHAAEGFGLDVEIHSPGPAHRQLMAALRNSNYYEMSLVHPKTREIGRTQEIYADGYRDELTGVDANGHVGVPSGPGLGVVYDWDAIDAHTTETTEFK